MKPEVFFCSVNSRNGLTEKMYEHWLGLGVSIRPLSPRNFNCTNFDFQRLRRAYADAFAHNEIYLLVDDDVEAITDYQIGIKALEEHPEFAIISAFPSNCNISRWTPENYQVFEDLDVTEVNDVGGLRVIRRGCMKNGWPEQSRVGYDLEHCTALRKAGYKVGYSNHFKCLHHGEHKSQLWRTQNV
jgi:hypothetical protein